MQQFRQKHIVINNYFASFTKHSFLRTDHKLSSSFYYQLYMFLNSPSISLSFANILPKYTIEFISFPLSLSFCLCHLCILSKYPFSFPSSLFLQLSFVYFLFYFTCFYNQKWLSWHFIALDLIIFKKGKQNRIKNTKNS